MLTENPPLELFAGPYVNENLGVRVSSTTHINIRKLYCVQVWLLKGLDSWDYGFRVLRKLEIRQPNACQDSGNGDWTRLLGPITASEAWHMANKHKLYLQGIATHLPNGNLVRIFLPLRIDKNFDADSLHILIQPEKDRRIPNAMMGARPNSSPLVDYLNHHVLEPRHLGWTMGGVDFLLTVVDEWVGKQWTSTNPNGYKGWWVSGIWRTAPEDMQKQAIVAGLGNVKFLVERLTRRRRAVERKRQRR